MTILRLLPGGIELQVREGETILQAVCREGFTYRFGCRRGGCGICKVEMVSGEVAYQRKVADTVLTDQERDDGVVLTCRAEPVSGEVVLKVHENNRLKLAVPLAFGLSRRDLKTEKQQTRNQKTSTPERRQGCAG